MLAFWLTYVVAFPLWGALAGVPSLGPFLTGGSPVVVFATSFGWCRSNDAKNERMRNLYGMWAVTIEEAPTQQAKCQMLLDIQTAMIQANNK
jgi:hypothetical protein